MFITTSSHAESGQRQFKCMLSQTVFPYTTGNDQSRNDAEAAARSHQGAILQGLMATQGLKEPFVFSDALAAYERSVA